MRKGLTISLALAGILAASAKQSACDVARGVLDRRGHPAVELTLDNTDKALTSPEGFRIRSNGEGIVISSPSEAGLLYGAFALERIKGSSLWSAVVDTVENPVIPLRIIDHWDNLDGTVERGYAGRSLWQWDSLPAKLSPRYREYAEKCAETGINGIVLNNVNASPKILSDEYLPKVAALADCFRPYGIRIYLSANFASPMVLDSLPSADPLLPDVAEWWRKKADEIYILIPDFGGFLVKANSEGQPGPGDYGRSHSQGANMLAAALKPYGGIVMWRSFVYSPSSADRAMQAYDEFMPLDGDFADNVILQVKNGPVDFQPREPYSPLFTGIKATPLMPEFQITQEYLGQANHLAFLAPMWEEFFGFIEADKLAGIAGVANIGDGEYMTGHPLADANRYAFGRLAWNPGLSSETVAREWLSAHLIDGNGMEMPDETREALLEMLLSSREAVVDYMMPLGLHHIFAPEHHYGPGPWWAPEGVRSDWTPPYYHKADTYGIGFDRTSSGSGAVEQYPEPLRTQYADAAGCPENLLLWFHHLPWNHTMKSGKTLWEELCLHYQKGVDTVDGWQAVWESAKPYIDPAVYQDVRERLVTQAKDARWWRDACLLYFGQFSGMPLPEGVEPPAKTLEEYMAIDLPLSYMLGENPPAAMLDAVR